MTATSVVLNDGHAMPQIGFGVYQIADAQAPTVVAAALQAGFRSIDTAAIYGNETGVGRAVAQSGLSRDAVFVITKLWNDRHGRGEPRRALGESLRKLGLAFVDLYLIHWPCPQQGRFVAAWRELIALRDEGLARSIGVSNFLPAHLERIIGETGVVPAVNQIELHPHFQQRNLRGVHAGHRIVTQSWSPLGRGRHLDDPVIAAITRAHGRSAAQVVLRWHMQSGLSAIPKTATPSRIGENAAIFDFALSEAEMAQIAGIDRADGRTGPDPGRFC